MIRFAVAIVTSFLLLAGTAHACTNSDLVPTPRNLERVRAAVLCLHNEERAKRGLAKLGSNRKLRRAATRHSRDMVRRDFFDHTNLDGLTPWDRSVRAGYTDYAALGENIAWGTGSLATPRSIMRSWMNSPGHRRNILTASYRDAGIGVAYGAPSQSDGATYTAVFGRR